MPNTQGSSFAAGFARGLANVLNQRRQDQIRADERRQELNAKLAALGLEKGLYDFGDAEQVAEGVFGPRDPKAKKKAGAAPDERDVFTNVIGHVLSQNQGVDMSARDAMASASTGPGAFGTPQQAPPPADPHSLNKFLVGANAPPQAAPQAPANADPRTGGDFMGVPLRTTQEAAAVKQNIQIGLFKKMVEALTATGIPQEQAAEMAMGFAPSHPATPSTPAGFTLGVGQQRYDAAGNLIASGPDKPETPAATPAPFTLGPGQQRFGPDGKPIASVAPRPSEPSASAQNRADKKADEAKLVEAVIANPAAFDNLPLAVQAAIVPELHARGFSGFGRTMNESAVKQLAETRAAMDSLADLRTVLGENEQYIGPIAGFQALNPYSEARKAQSKIDLVKQRVGKALEGGVLRKEDEEKYKKILATLNDEPTTAIYKVDSLIKTLENDMKVFLDEQRMAGRRTGDRAAASEAPDRIAARKYLVDNKLPVTDANIDHYLAQAKKK